MSAGLPAINTVAMPTDIGSLLSLRNQATLTILGFLDPFQLAVVERVCRAWRLVAEPVWKNLHVNTLRIPGVSLGYVKQALEVVGFDDKVLSLIAAYGRISTNYREDVREMLGFVQINSSWLLGQYAQYIKAPAARGKQANNQTKPLPFVHIGASFVPLNLQCPVKEDDWCYWHRSPPFGVQPFHHNRIPLRLFVNRDGSYKEKGDLIRIEHLGRRLIVKCVDARMPFGAPSPVPVISEAIEYRIQKSIDPAIISISLESVAQEKSAAAISGEWIDIP
jgi:hypothetical protein